MTDQPEPIDPDEYARSLNGYDELAIERAFRKSLSDLSGTSVPRAIYFTIKRREGMADKDAYTTAMTITLGELEPMFRTPGEPDPE